MNCIFGNVNSLYHLEKTVKSFQIQSLNQDRSKRFKPYQIFYDLFDYKFELLSTHPFKISEIVKDSTHSKSYSALNFCHNRRKTCPTKKTKFNQVNFLQSSNSAGIFLYYFRQCVKPFFFISKTYDCIKFFIALKNILYFLLLPAL